MGLKEDVLALAEELDGVSVKENCEACLASGTELCRGDLECAESAHKACAKRLRAIAEHDADDVTTVSAYDLLSEEDRDAIAWVREHGGLERVKKLLDWVVGHCSTKQQLDFDFWLSGRVMYELGFEEDMADRDEVEGRLLARLMPEGIEWPKHTDGELVRIGGCWGEDGCDTSITYIERIIFAEDGVYLDNEYNEAFYRHGERVKRPESWERLEEDATKNPFDYCKDVGHRLDTCENSEAYKACDLVRRAKKLAERGEL